MNTSYLYQNIESMTTSKEIMNRSAKTQTLNILKDKLLSLSDSTDNIKIKALIAYNILMLEDCYNIDMYKFQFKGLKDMIEKDLKNLEESIALETI
jgi:hypothetical protein